MQSCYGVGQRNSTNQHLHGAISRKAEILFGLGRLRSDWKMVRRHNEVLLEHLSRKLLRYPSPDVA